MRNTLPSPYQDRPLAVLLRAAFDKRRGKEPDLTIKQVATEMGIKPDQVSRYLRGDTVPYRDTTYVLETIAKGFRVPFDKVHKAARERPKKGLVYDLHGKYVTPDVLEAQLADWRSKLTEATESTP